MAFRDLPAGVEGLFGGLERGSEMLRHSQESARAERRALLENLTLLGGLIEDYPDLEEEVSGILPEPSLSKLRTAARTKEEALASYLKTTPDIARMLRKRPELLKAEIERLQRTNYGSIAGDVTGLIQREQESAGVPLTRAQAYQRVLSKMPPEQRAAVLGLPKEYHDAFGAQPSFQEEAASMFGRYTASILQNAEADPALAARLIQQLSLTARGKPMSWEELKSMLPNEAARLEGNEAFTKEFSKTLGGATAAVTPIPTAGARTPQQIEAHGAGLKAGAEAGARLRSEADILMSPVRTATGEMSTVGAVLQSFKATPSISTEIVKMLRDAESAGELTPDQRFKALIEIGQKLTPQAEAFGAMARGALPAAGIQVPPSAIEEAQAAIGRATRGRTPSRPEPTMGGYELQRRGERAAMPRREAEVTPRQAPSRMDKAGAQKALSQLSEAVSAGDQVRTDMIATNLVRAALNKGRTPEQIATEANNLAAPLKAAILSALQRESR